MSKRKIREKENIKTAQKVKKSRIKEERSELMKMLEIMNNKKEEGVDPTRSLFLYLDIW